MAHWQRYLAYQQPDLAHWQRYLAHWQRYLAHWQRYLAHWQRYVAHWRRQLAHWQRYLAHQQPDLAHWQRYVAHWQETIGSPATRIRGELTAIRRGRAHNTVLLTKSLEARTLLLVLEFHHCSGPAATSRNSVQVWKLHLHWNRAELRGNDRRERKK